MLNSARKRRWTGWAKRKPSVVRPFPSLRAEELESRLAPASFIWTGAASDKWANPLNWQGNVAPTGNPAAVEDLVFNSFGAARPSTDNNIGSGATFNSITFGTGGYTIGGFPIVLGRPGVINSGTILLNDGVPNTTIQVDTTLAAGGASPVDQSIRVGDASDLSITGRLIGVSNTTLTKDGTGTLSLKADNHNFVGSIKVNNNSGVLVIGHQLALGDSSSPTTIGSGSTLDVQNVGIAINEPLILNGLGAFGDGALRSIAGVGNIWAGQITLDSDAAIGANTGTTLSITGQIIDSGAGHALTKEGFGEVQLNSLVGNTYRGLTTVNNGILTVGTPLALGTTAGGTVVNEITNGSKAGQLRLRSFTGADFTVLNETLTLNGDGVSATPDPRASANQGSLTDTVGNNTWAGPVILGSAAPNGVSVTIGAALGLNMTISGIVSSPNGAFAFNKVDQGRVILNNVNTYTGPTTVTNGFLNIRDSSSLGSTAAGTSVTPGGTLELEVEAADPTNIPQFDAQGRNLGNDSVTNDPHKLSISEPILIAGRGFGNLGALRSISGVNVVLGGVTLSGSAAIGVEVDQRVGHPTPDYSYFINDYSLTVGATPATGPLTGGTLIKRGGGDLILPIASTYTGQTLVEQGWITIQNNNSLGPYQPTLGPTVQPDVIVSSGAALHIKKLTAASADLNINKNITLSGNGPTNQTYGFINGKGALMNLSGNNTWSGEIRLNGTAGIGVEMASSPPAAASSLTVTNWVRDSAVGSLGGINKFGSQTLTLEGEGTYTGANNIVEGTLAVRHSMALGTATSGTLASQETYTTTNTTVQPGAVLTFDQSIATLNGGIASGLQIANERLILNGPAQQIAVAGPVTPAVATYTLSFSGQFTDPIPVNASAATVQTQINTKLTNFLAAIGVASVTVTQNANVYTVLMPEHANDVAKLTATPSTPPLGQKPAEVIVSGVTSVDGSPMEASVINLTQDNDWRGPIVMNTGSRIAVQANSRWSALGAVSDPGVAAPASLVKRGLGDMLAAGNNTFNGTTWIDQGLFTAASSQAFGSPTTGTVVSSNAQLQLQGSLTIGGEALSLVGAGPAAPPSLNDQWFSVGPAPTNNGQSPNSMPTSGRVTGVATDPTDPNVIYISTAGGGAWKSKDGGRTWRQLFDATVDPLAVMYGSQIAVSIINPNIVYFATGEANGAPNGTPLTGQQDNYAGTGVYKSTDAGLTWTQLLKADGTNPLFGQAITKLIINPKNPNQIWVASGVRNVLNADPNAVPGVYRYDGSAATPDWVNITAGASPNRLGVAGGTFATPHTPIVAGPDDDYRIDFPQTNATWSDILLVASGVNSPGANPGNRVTEPTGEVVTWVLYAALGSSTQQYAITVTSPTAVVQTPGIFNAVYRTEDPEAAAPTWWLGQGSKFPVAQTSQTPAAPPIATPTTPDGEGTPYPVGPITPPPPTVPQPGRNSWIKLAGSVTEYYNTNIPGGTTKNATITVYASNLPNGTDNWAGSGTGQSLDVQVSGWDGGLATGWTALPLLSSAIFGTNTGGQTALGTYDNTMIVQDFNPGLKGSNNPQVVYIGGMNQVYRSTNGLTAEFPIVAGPNTIAPANRFHALYLDPTSHNLLSGTDGGIWSWDGTNFTDMNGNLTTTLMNSADPHPSDIIQMFGGAYNNGLMQFTGDLAWATTGKNAGTHAGAVRYNPKNPLIAYADVSGGLWKTVDGGANWTLLRTVSTATNKFPLVVDDQNPNRILVGGSDVFQSLQAGVAGTFVGLGSGINPEQIAVATYQGPYQQDLGNAAIGDSGFPLVTDKLSNTYDPDTIYVNGSGLFRVTKNSGVSWQTRAPFNDFAFTLTFSGGLANVNVNQVRGVLGGGGPGGPPPDPGVTGATVQNGGSGLNEIQTIEVVKATGSFYRLRLTVPGSPPGFYGTTDPIPANATAAQVQLALNQLAGMDLANTHTPPRTLGTGHVDVTAATPSQTVTSITVDPGNRDRVFVTVSGTKSNTGSTVFGSKYAGLTDTNDPDQLNWKIWVDLTGNLPAVQTWSSVFDPRSDTMYVGNEEGVWQLTNVSQYLIPSRDPSDPLGAVYTTPVWTRFGAGLPNVSVRDLQLNQTLNTLTAATYGRGTFQLFLTDYQASSGAIRAVSGSSIWTGPVTLTGSTTMGAAGTQALQNGIAAAQINFVGSISDATAGANYTVTKVGLGTITFSGQNNVGNGMGGQVIVSQGVLQANNSYALGFPVTPSTPNGNTIVQSGAALELRSDLAEEPVTLNGDGIAFNGHNTGALRNISNDNTYTGTLTFNTNTTIGVDSGTSLTIGTSPVLPGPGTITDNNPGHSFAKELTGTLILSSANTYRGTTTINQGALRAMNALALGTTAGGTVVLDGAQLQLAGGITIAGEALSLTGTGINTTGALQNYSDNNTYAGPITLDNNPGFAPATVPGNQIGIGVRNALDVMTISGAIGQSLARGIIKVGPGTAKLTSLNTYTGLTTVAEGALRVANNGALGTTAAGTVVNTGAVLEMDGSAGNITVTDEALTLNGDGLLPGRAGALNNIAGNNAWIGTAPGNGAVTLATNSSIGAVAGTQLTVSSRVQDPATPPVPAASLRKAGLGTVIFPNSNTYGGKTIVDQGVLNIRNATSLGTIRNEQQQVQVIGSNGAFDLTFDGFQTISLPFDATQTQVQNALNALPNVGSEIQTIRVAGNPAGTFTLSYNAVSSAVVHPVGDSAANIANDLNTSGILPAGVSVLVSSSSPTPGVTVYTVTFQSPATAAPINALQIGATAAGGATATTATLKAGGNHILVTTNVVSPTNRIHTIDFTTGVGNKNQSQLVPSLPTGTTAQVTTIRDGAEGTTVTAGATLQVQGGITEATEAVTINGSGFNGQGALENVSVSNTWSVPLTLGSNATIGVDVNSDTLSFTQPINDGVAKFNLDLLGLGTLRYAATVDQGYDGTTTVKSGTLLLDQPATGLAIVGPLVVGDSVLPGATARENQDNQIADTVPVTVQSDGVFTLNAHTDRISNLTVTDGTATTGGSGHLTTDNVNLTGGIVSVNSATAIFTLNGNVTATSDASGSSFFFGSGTLELNGANRTFNVADGPQALDLILQNIVTASGGERLIKTGAGRMQVPSGTTFSALMEDNAGEISVDGTVGDILLTGGTLTGIGRVATVIGASGGAAVGTVAPGQNYTANPIGKLTSGGESWGSNTTFLVDLANQSGGPGTGYDQLVIDGGTLDLNNATLGGTAAAGIGVGDSFIIVQASNGGQITGKFNEPFSPNAVFVGGQKFTVVYNRGANGSVVLTHVKSDSTVAVSAVDLATPTQAANPATLGQPILFVATVVPEAGAGPAPLGTSVTFTLDGAVYGPFTITGYNALGQATVSFDPQLATGGPLSAGTHTVHADFSGDALLFNSAGGNLVPDELIEVPAISVLSANQQYISPTNTSSIGVQDTVTYTATATNERNPSSVWTVTVTGNGHTVVLTGPTNIPAGGNTFPISAVWDGKDASLVVPDGTYSAVADYTDPYGNHPVSSPVNVILDNTSPSFPALTADNPVFAPGTASTAATATTFTTTITDANFRDWTLEIRDAASNALIRTYTDTTTNVSVTWDGRSSAFGPFVSNGLYNTRLIARDLAGNTTVLSGAQVVKLSNAPTVTLTSNTPTIYGQTITLTATITLPAYVPLSSANLLVGSQMQFFNGATPLGTSTVANNGGLYQAVLTVGNSTNLPIFNAGTYSSLRASFLGNTSYLPATSANAQHVVNRAPLTATADPKSKQYGDPNPPLTYTLTGLVNGDSNSVVTGTPATTATAASPVGTYPITRGSVASNGNYTLTFVNGILTVGKANLSITADNVSSTYGSPLNPLTITVIGLVNGDTAGNVVSGSPVTTASSTSPAGLYPITQGTIGVNNNYTFTFTSGTYQINRAPLTITAADTTKVYGDPVPTLTYSISGLVNGDTAAVVSGSPTTTAMQSSPAGQTFPITQGSVIANSNYTVNFVNGTLTVTQAPLQVTADDKFKVVGDSNPSLTFTPLGLTNGDTIANVFTGALDTTATTASPVGSYPITQGTLQANGSAGANYIMTFFNGTMTVLPSPITLTVVADPQSKTYGAAIPTLTYQASGFQNGDTAATVLAGSLATTATTSSPAGTSFPITQGTLHTINPLYSITYTSAQLTVTKAPLTIKADDKTRPYNTPNPALTATYTGLVNGDSQAVVSGVNLTTTATQSSPLGAYPITSSTTPTAANYNITFVPGTLTIQRLGGLGLTTDTAVGTGAGLPAEVDVYNAQGLLKERLFPFPGFSGGVRTATGDFNGDGIADIVAGTGPGAVTEVVVFDGSNGNTLFQTQPFESSFTGGVYVSAGDITGDGKPELIISPDEGGGPRVQVFHTNFQKMADFFGIDDANFRGGARSTVGDFTGDGVGDLVVAAGYGGGPRIAVFDGAALTNGQLTKPYNDFFIFEKALRNGAFIAAGDVNGDGYADMIAGGGPGGGPRVLIVDGQGLLHGQFTQLSNFFAADVEFRGGVHVVAKDINGDKYADVITGDGLDTGSRVTGYSGQTLLAGGTVWQFGFDAYPGFLGGVYVG